ncbi:AAA family ATPase [Pelomyxa schiedti]|nr:AAA family ATPase [Pelomyxa schiedti]
MEKAVALVREAVSLPLRFPEIFSSLNIHSPRGILLKGEPGVGKTLLVNFIAHEFGATLYTINGPELYSSFIGDSEKALKAVFDKALDTAHTSSASGSFTPCIIFIDEIDSLCPTRSLESGQESRVVTQLVSCMDTISNSADHVVVLAATNRPNAIDPALRRPGRFDRELEIPVPDTSEREKILSVHTRQMPLQRDVHLTEIAKDCVGYVGADLASLCREAAILAIKEAAKTSNPDPSVSASHFSAALKLVPPSTQRSTFVSDLDVVTWSDIGGLEDVKRELHEAIELPLLHPEVFTRFGISPAKGVLLHGPSGCAKTTLVKAAANSSKVSFLSISGAAIYSPYLGDAEQTVRETFKRARLGAPAILFFDEIDAIVGQRDTLGSHRDSVKERVLSTILNEMDGIEKLCGVLVVAATNRPDLLDKALLRAGRFDRHVAVPLPDEATRQAILRVHTRKMPLAPDITLNSFATASEGMSGAEIAALCREAAMESLRENINNATVTALHFTKVMERLNSKTAAPQIIPTKPLFSFVPPEKTISTTPPPQQNGTSN